MAYKVAPHARLHQSRRPEERPIIVVASGMRGTGVTTVATMLQSVISTLEIVDVGARWADIHEQLDRRSSRMLAITTDDIVSVSSMYALIKLTREHYPHMIIDVLAKTDQEFESLKVYERIQYATRRFLGESVGYAGWIPHDPQFGNALVGSIQHLAVRLGDEVTFTASTVNEHIHRKRSAR